MDLWVHGGYTLHDIVDGDSIIKNQVHFGTSCVSETERTQPSNVKGLRFRLVFVLQIEKIKTFSKRKQWSTLTTTSINN